MKKLTLVIISFLSVIIICTRCNKKEEETKPFKIDGLTYENFPVIDGSTSTDPLVKLIACKLLQSDYYWMRSHLETWGVFTDLPEEFVEQHLKSSQTHNAFINLIDKKADMIFSARKMSDDEKLYAANAGVNLIETSIALDALIFVVNVENGIKSLTHEQLKDIYTKKIKNWKDVGGNNEQITPYIRNKNSGSQELMETLVFKGEPIPDDFPEDNIISSMMGLFTDVQENINGLGYTVYYYKENIIRDLITVKTLRINDVYPDSKTIKNKNYPYVAEVYVIIRSDLERSSMAYRIYELMRTTAGKEVIRESGYVPN